VINPLGVDQLVYMRFSLNHVTSWNLMVRGWGWKPLLEN